MKCDELKPIKQGSVELGEYWVYDAEDVDAAIAELKANLEDVQATAYTESVDAGMENRRLKRALWLARANYCHNFRIDWYIRLHPGTKMTQSTMENILIVAELNCRAKAEEYK